MATKVTVVGWHIHPDAAICEDCGASASSLVDDGRGWPGVDLCHRCLDESGRYEVVSDVIASILDRAIAHEQDPSS